LFNVNQKAGKEMPTMDYVELCRNYYTITRIPVSLIEGKHTAYSAIGELLGLGQRKDYVRFWDAPYEQLNPVLCRISADIEYAAIHVEGTEYYIILGPAFSIPVSESIVRTYMQENLISPEHLEAVTEFLCAIPLTTSQQFFRHAVFLHMSLNRKDVDWNAFYHQKDAQNSARPSLYLNQIQANLEEQNLHNTYDFEQDLFRKIKNGNTEQLEAFLASAYKPLSEGKMASSPLRHAKNLFISTVTKAGVLGAIPGGVNVEQVYQLLDLYVQECERAQTIDAVKSLQYSMLLDFCRRAGEAQIPDGISKDVYQCICFIQNHLNEPLSVSDVAQCIHRSDSYIIRRFKEELGISMGAYITRCKLSEAKMMLTYSDKSLAEISSYLCFSSQSYFQNVFKKQFGITPMQYRKESQKQ